MGEQVTAEQYTNEQLNSMTNQELAGLSTDKHVDADLIATRKQLGWSLRRCISQAAPKARKGTHPYRKFIGGFYSKKNAGKARANAQNFNKR